MLAVYKINICFHKISNRENKGRFFLGRNKSALSCVTKNAGTNVYLRCLNCARVFFAQDKNY